MRLSYQFRWPIKIQNPNFSLFSSFCQEKSLNQKSKRKKHPPWGKPNQSPPSKPKSKRKSKKENTKHFKSTMMEAILIQLILSYPLLFYFLLSSHCSNIFVPLIHFIPCSRLYLALPLFVASFACYFCSSYLLYSISRFVHHGPHCSRSLPFVLKPLPFFVCSLTLCSTFFIFLYLILEFYSVC